MFCGAFNEGQQCSLKQQWSKAVEDKRCCSFLHLQRFGCELSCRDQSYLWTPTPPVPGCGPYRPAGQVGHWKRQIGIKTFGVNNRCGVKLLSLLPLLSRLEVLVCGLAVCVEDLTWCRGWFIIVCLVRGLEAQPISCFMSFVYGFGLILSEKQEWALFFPFLKSPFVASGEFLTTRGRFICAKWFCFPTSSWKRWNSFSYLRYYNHPLLLDTHMLFLSGSSPSGDNVMSVGHFPHSICNWLQEQISHQEL